MFRNGAQFCRLLRFFHSSTADEMLRMKIVALMHPWGDRTGGNSQKRWGNGNQWWKVGGI